MIKIKKDLSVVPTSLIPAYAELFPHRVGANLVPIPLTSLTTHGRRLELIVAEEYIDHPNYNSRYKQNDIKQALQVIYKGKCAFCEQNEELTHVEHYRPKATYYWLAYSWDNLLLACPTCNANKGSNFDLDGVQTAFVNTDTNIKAINSSSSTYDLSEIPKLVNPEITNPSEQIYFEKSGEIRSNDARFKYTIEKCGIDRKSLNDRRRSILNRFKEHIRDGFIINQSAADQLIAVKTNMSNFINDSKDENEEFLAFRHYAINNGWLNDIVKDSN